MTPEPSFLMNASILMDSPARSSSRHPKSLQEDSLGEAIAETVGSPTVRPFASETSCPRFISVKSILARKLVTNKSTSVIDVTFFISIPPTSRYPYPRYESYLISKEQKISTTL